MPPDAPSDRTLVGLIARHRDLDPDGLGVRRCPTGQFNTTYFMAQYQGSCHGTFSVAADKRGQFHKWT